MRRPTYAEVVSTLALVVATSTGGAYAAGKITGRDVADGSLTGRDVKQSSISRGDLAPAARGLRGPVGATGPTGATGPAGVDGVGGPAVESVTDSQVAAGPEGLAVRSVTVGVDQAGLNLLTFSAGVAQFGSSFEASSQLSCSWRVNDVFPSNSSLPLVRLTTASPTAIVPIADAHLLPLAAGDVVSVFCFDAESETLITAPRMVLLKISDAS